MSTHLRSLRPVQTAPTSGPVDTTPHKSREMFSMLMHEELARARIQDIHRAAGGRGEVRRARAARRWNRMARWAERRARRLSP